MSRCPFCGERYIGDRFGIGTHLSSVLIGLVAGTVTAIVTSLVFGVRW